MHRKFIILVLLLVSARLCYSQQVPVYSQYIMNEFIINPAVAGIDGMTTINFSGRKQWINVKYAPETYSASISTRILKSPLSIKKSKYKQGSDGRVGIGAAFVSDVNGAMNRTNIQFSYAYHIFLNNSQLSFGLKAYATQFKVDESLVEFRNQNDPIRGRLGQTALIPDAGAGISYSAPNYNVGLSVNNILQSAIKFGQLDLEIDNSVFKLEHIRQYVLYGYFQKVLSNRDWSIEPAVLIRGTEQASFSADISSRLIYKREYWAGMSVRTTGDFVFLLGLKMNRFYIGYSLDYGFNRISLQSWGSHEVVLAVKFGDSVRRYRWMERY